MRRTWRYWYWRIRATWTLPALWLELRWRWKTRPWRPAYWRSRRLFKQRLIEFRQKYPRPPP